MKTSPAGRALIKEFESFRSKPYLCPAGKPTIGWGFCSYPNGRRVAMTDPPITVDEAEPMLSVILAGFEDDVYGLVRVPLKQCQFDALVSFAYNVGSDIDADTIAEGLGDSTLLRKLNAGDYEGAAQEFPKWNKSGGKVTAGLIRRREAEQAMFRGKAV